MRSGLEGMKKWSGRVFLSFWLGLILFLFVKVCFCHYAFVQVGQVTRLTRVTLPDIVSTQPGR